MRESTFSDHFPGEQSKGPHSSVGHGAKQISFHSRENPIPVEIVGMKAGTGYNYINRILRDSSGATALVVIVLKGLVL